MTVSVGNLRVGGTGKTTMVEYLIRMLKPERQVVTLSRGYGRKTRGFLVADKNSDPTQIGDEPMQLYKKFGSEIHVTVGEERVLAIPEIMARFPTTDVIILDDAYQHRKIRPHLNILLSDYSQPFFSDHILPVGRLRESRKGAQRADMIVFTKCPPTISTDTMERYREKTGRYSGAEVPIFFAKLAYENPVHAFGPRRKTVKQIIAFSGIANPEPFLRHLELQFDMCKFFQYPDHHFYRPGDVKKMITYARSVPVEQLAFITTEKDLTKVRSYQSLFQSYPLYYLPVSSVFIEYGEKFDERVRNAINHQV
jgi:tetraacyldisaccharide 4'-kinase